MGSQPVGLSQGPAQDDQRELVPDKGTSSQVELLLTQVMEENLALRKRLEQVELRSQSSWHSGMQGEGIAGMSPVSFTVEGSQRFVDPVQQWSSLGRFVGSAPGVPYGTSLANFSGPMAGQGSVGVLPEGVLGGQQSLGGTRFPGLPVGELELPKSAGVTRPSDLSGPGGFSSSERCEMVPFIPRESPWGSHIAMGGATPTSVAPPPPVPIAAPGGRRESVSAIPQSMRQFTTSAGVEASGIGQASGFHTPRSVGMGRAGFDEHGYPVSPGGTVIRPPPGPPPLSSGPSVGGPNMGIPGLGPSGAGAGLSGLGASRSAADLGVVRPEEPAKYIR